ncbi:uncharacterized protein LOC141665738 [Apium graveolens]|uniref:uncharacterized protein LOC141665738 n=1 Tax=Apium graveolens TaxID=4045 RepID=UPI003D78C2DE
MSCCSHVELKPSKNHTKRCCFWPEIGSPESAPVAGFWKNPVMFFRGKNAQNTPLSSFKCPKYQPAGKAGVVCVCAMEGEGGVAACVPEVADAAKDFEKERIDFRTFKFNSGSKRAKNDHGFVRQWFGGQSGQQGQWREQNQNMGGQSFHSQNQYVGQNQNQQFQRQKQPRQCGSQHNPTSRVFVVTANQVAANSGTVSGTLLIGRRDAYVLFNTGSTHSVVSLSFVRHFGVVPFLLYPHYSIATPMGNSVIISDVYRECLIAVGDINYMGYLLPMEMHDFDIILGKDWLIEHRATIDCQGKMDISKDKPHIEDYPVVKEYTDVFPDELPSFPPHREVEFTIELVPGVEPISKTLYCMAPLELQELKERLQELLDRGFIRPKEVAFLGHIVSGRGIELDPVKVEAITNWPRPSNVIEGVKFEWNNDREKSFKELKNRLVSAPILVLPSGSGGFQVYNDASKRGLGCVLMQHGKVISYTSRQLKPYKKELNMRQQRWLELFKDYDANIQYHPGKANLVADALSRKNFGSVVSLISQSNLISDLERLGVELYIGGSGGSILSLKVEPNLVSRVKESQKTNTVLDVIRSEVASGKRKHFCVDDEGVIWLGGKSCVPADPAIREEILKEARSSSFSIHPGSSKMYGDLKKHFWWSGMKGDIAEFVGKYLTYQQFAYNNSWHTIIGMPPFEALYSRRCRAPSCWDEVGERVIKGPELVRITNEKVDKVKKSLKEARSRQKSYADQHKKFGGFEPGDHVFLKVSPCMV